MEINVETKKSRGRSKVCLGTSFHTTSIIYNYFQFGTREGSKNYVNQLEEDIKANSYLRRRG